MKCPVSKQERECLTDNSILSRTKRHSRTSFVPIEMLMKNNLSFATNIAAKRAERVGIVGVVVIGAEGGGPGAMSGNPYRNALAVVV